jgi:hypothetical protein
MRLDRTPVEEIAFLVDDTTFAFTPPGSTWLNGTNKRLLHAVGRTGAPVGTWLLSDLGRLPDRIKMVVVASASAATDTDLERLRGLLDRGGLTVAVVGPAGLVAAQDGRWRPDRPGELLGLPLEVIDEPLPTGALEGTPSVASHPDVVRPRVQALSPGRFRYPDGAPASAERTLPGGGRLIWLGAPPLSSELWRQWAESAGVHCYAPTGFFVHAARELVSVTAPAAGRAVVRLPQAAAATDLFDGFQAQGRGFDCPFGAGQTRLLEVRRTMQA